MLMMKSNSLTDATAICSPFAFGPYDACRPVGRRPFVRLVFDCESADNTVLARYFYRTALCGLLDGGKVMLEFVECGGCHNVKTMNGLGGSVKSEGGGWQGGGRWV